MKLLNWIYFMADLLIDSEAKLHIEIILQRIAFLKICEVDIMNKEYIEKLVQLMKENPSLDVMCMVDSDIVADDGYAWWLGRIDKKIEPKIDEYSTALDEKVIFKSDKDYT